MCRPTPRASAISAGAARRDDVEACAIGEAEARAGTALRVLLAGVVNVRRHIVEAEVTCGEIVEMSLTFQ